MQTKKYSSRSIKKGQEENSIPKMWNRKKAAIVGLKNSSIQTGVPKSIVKEKNKQKDIRRIFKMLREIQLNIEVEKIDIHEGVIVKALLDSSVIGMFMNRKIAAKYGFRLQKLERPVMVINVNGTNNSGQAITHQVEVSVYYKSHIEKMRIDMCDLERTDIILRMLWLLAHNLEINWETEEVKMTRCLLLCRRNTKLEKGQKVKKEKRVVMLEKEKIVRQIIDNKKNWKREKKVEADHRKIKEIVPRKSLKQRKVFRKVKSERIPMRKIQDYTIDLKKTFKLQKERIYSLSKDEREEIHDFVNNQLRKRYIRLSKSPQTLLVFFVDKKNGSKRMVIDYHSLNDQTVKNNYLLLLITDLINNIGSKRIFTKMDLQWRFNNMRIKEKDE